MFVVIIIIIPFIYLFILKIPIFKQIFKILSSKSNFQISKIPIFTFIYLIIIFGIIIIIPFIYLFIYLF